MTATAEPGIRSAKKRTEERRVLVGTMVGTTIEWYDFFIYAQAAGLVLAALYFAPLGQGTGLAQLISWASIGISFLFRPLGAIVAGHLGDRLGRKSMLVATLVTMGAATALIGVLPTFADIGVAAPLLLIFLRILQGFSAGGEWGGAALMSVEHAPVGKRGLFGAYPQIGVPCGLILATGVILAVTNSMSNEAFLSWGWRIPFLISVILIGIGYIIRRSVSESPVFAEMQARKQESAAPLTQLFTHHTREVVLTALIFVANNAAGYLLIAFFASYASRPIAVGGLGMARTSVLVVGLIAAVFWLASTMWGGILSDRIGRIRTFQIGFVWIFVWAIPMFLLIDSANILLFGVALIGLASGLGLSYGPQAALYSEMFPAAVRYSGVSIGYALGAILGGAFAPLIAQLLLDTTGWSPSVGIYIMVLAVISFIAVTLVKETKGIPLGVSGGH